MKRFLLFLLLFIAALLSGVAYAVLELRSPAVYIVATPGKVDSPLGSAFFPSRPYQPKGETYPLDPNGKPMALIAQINCAELPRLKDFPEQGILQFFINAHDDLLGWDGESFEKQGGPGYRVRYFPELLAEDALEDIRQPDHGEDSVLPITTEGRLTFEQRTDWMNADDWGFQRSIFNRLPGRAHGALAEWLWDRERGPLHQVGGFANFVQDDPRWGSKEEWRLLFQMDSDGAMDIMWGDVGIGNFFIRPEDLKRLDFSKVAYEYSCS